MSLIILKAPNTTAADDNFGDTDVRLDTVSLGSIGFMSIRNKYGHTLVNPNFCSADTWP